MYSAQQREKVRDRKAHIHTLTFNRKHLSKARSDVIFVHVYSWLCSGFYFIFFSCFISFAEAGVEEIAIHN